MIIWGNVAPSSACILTGFVFTFSHHCFATEITVPYVALGVFVVASASDLVDGWIARRFNMTTGIGMVLDPFADKLMHISVLFCLAFCTGLTPLGQQTASLTDGWYIHYAFVILVLAKEGFMVLMSPFVMKRGAKIQANWMGKVASATISIGVILCFFHPYVYLADWGILAWGVALSYGALIGYIKEIVHQIKLIDAGKMERVTDESVKYTNAENTALLHPVETEVAADTDSQN